jgi:hypothetical protein
MRFPIGGTQASLLVTGIAATPTAPSDLLPSSNVLKTRQKDGRTPDTVTINVEFPDAAAQTVYGLLLGYDADLAAWVSSRSMLFGNAAACLADTSGLTSGKHSVFLDSSVTHLFFMPDFDNATGTPATMDYALRLDEHREHF